MHYFCSDLHFGHERTVLFERKQFKSVEEHDAYYYKKIKDIMTPSDTLYVLGDIGLSVKEDFFKSIPGKKVLILGNHDKRSKSYYFRIGFDEVYNHPVFYSRRIVLSHEPIPVTDDVLNVHGHLHNAIIDKDNYFNVNIFFIDKPIKITSLEKKMMALPKMSLKYGEEWFAPLYKFITNVEDKKEVGPDGHIDFEKLKKLKQNEQS